MLFNSYIFILIFLPLCLAGYYTLNHFGLFREGLIFLLGMSLWFYGYFNPWYLILICTSIGANYLFYRLLILPKYEKTRKLIFTAGILFNLGVLGYFKYTDFFIRNINAVFRTDIPLQNILLPLGISFFTFQQISFITDTYRGVPDKAARYTLIEYAAYIAFFPQLVAGPIVTHDILVPQLKDPGKKKINWEYMSKGLAIFTLGLAKKVLLADAFGNVVKLCFPTVEVLNTASASIAMLSYTFQIYFDFSGYSDMAVGLGWMLGIDLPVNFDSPYKAKSVSEFWERWHMTLTSFFTKYVYIPLGGSRKGKAATYRNIFIVFFLSGLWHGAGWNFILWGVMHGMAMIFERAFKNLLDRIPGVIRWIFTFGFINVTWVFFRAADIKSALVMLRCIAGMNFDSIDLITGLYSPFMKKLMDQLQLTGILPSSVPVIMFLVFALAIVLLLPNAKALAERSTRYKLAATGLAVLLTWCVLSFSGMSTFLYFNF